MKKLLFRADGNKVSGLGHLYRIFALIEMYRDTYGFILLIKSDSEVAIIPSNVEFKTIPQEITIEQEPDWLSRNFSANDFMVVADGYHFNSQYQLALKKLNYQLMVIDDFAKEKVYADYVVNHAMGIKNTDYHSEPYTQFALGPKYAILRPGFLQATKESRKINKVENTFVCFGGSDQFDLSYKCVLALLQFPKIKKVNLVVGAAYQGADIFELAKKDTRLIIHQNLSEDQLLEVMKVCDFAVAPSSNILYEIFAVKMPVLSGFYVENQMNIYKGSLENHLIFGGGDMKNFSVEDFVSKISEIINLNDFETMVKAQSQIFDTQIKERFLKLFRSITYRKAGENDLMLVFEWANDPVARANSYASSAIDLETHKNWYENKLRDVNAMFFIAECDGIPAGLVRYEKKESVTVVGILVSEKFRGRGLASEFLIGTARLYFELRREPVLAYIKVKNVASIRSFESASYKKIGEENIQGAASIVFKLEKNDI